MATLAEGKGKKIQKD